MKLTLLTLAITAMLISNAFADTVIFECTNVISQQGAQATALPVEYTVTQTAAGFSATSKFLGSTTTTTNISLENAEVTDAAALQALASSVAPGLNSSTVTQGTFIDLPTGTNNDAPIKFMNFKDASGISILKVADISGGMMIGRCQK